jgi:hypothetical protein
MSSHKIEYTWLRTGFGHKRVMVTRLQQPGHLAVRIFQITEGHASCWTNGDACRIETLFNTVDAERALVGISVGMNEARIVRTGGNTRLAANAHIVRDEHNTAEIVDVAGPGRATIDARWVAAVIASLR